MKGKDGARANAVNAIQASLKAGKILQSDADQLMATIVQGDKEIASISPSKGGFPGTGCIGYVSRRYGSIQTQLEDIEYTRSSERKAKAKRTCHDNYII